MRKTMTPRVHQPAAPSGTQVAEVRLQSWSDFKSSFLPGLYAGGQFLRDRYLFRGQGRDYWKLESNFDRQFPIGKYGRGIRVKLYQEMLGLFRNRLADSDVPKDVINDERLLTALGQHHGLPTRLLDWSGSPYYAAFFAFSSNIQYFGTKDQVAIYVLDCTSSIWNQEYGVEIIELPPFSNRRIRVQQGKFTLQRTPDPTLDAYAERHEDRQALRKVIIPANQARTVIADLDSMGINHDTVFSDLDGIARASFFQVLYNNPAPDDPEA
jgi:FRG domain-containing protein